MHSIVPATFRKRKGNIILEKSHLKWKEENEEKESILIPFVQIERQLVRKLWKFRGFGIWGLGYLKGFRFGWLAGWLAAESLLLINLTLHKYRQTRWILEKSSSS